MFHFFSTDKIAQTNFASKFFCVLLPAREKDSYRLVGVVLAWSVAHGGPAGNFFSTTLYNSIAYEAGAKAPLLDDVPDQGLKTKITQVGLNNPFRKKCMQVTKSKPIHDLNKQCNLYISYMLAVLISSVTYLRFIYQFDRQFNAFATKLNEADGNFKLLTHGCHDQFNRKLSSHKSFSVTIYILATLIWCFGPMC